ncbi:uncharacterized protein [Dendrobates tinctorius]|uniref:uncharacterized protein n=1 Tax=Dendrobates tinctorius TaxID=92724 RepID=UPI003CC9F964
MDACTRHRVNYFAINVRFVCDKNEIVTKTLAVKDTKAHHTSEFLQVLVEKVLQDYELKREQVLSVVIDNASNMISTIKLMNESNDGDQQLEEHSGSTDTEMFEIEEHSIVTEEQTEVASDEQQHDSLDDLVETVSICSFIHHMRCVVHTLQLAIRDSLQEGHAAALIGKVRKLATVARTPKVDSILKRRAGKGAIIDHATRWGSTYLGLFHTSGFRRQARSGAFDRNRIRRNAMPDPVSPPLTCICAGSRRMAMRFIRFSPDPEMCLDPASGKNGYCNVFCLRRKSRTRRIRHVRLFHTMKAYERRNAPDPAKAGSGGRIRFFLSEHAQ